MNGPSRRARAFTFLEIMLVLGIVGMLALIVMPDFRSFARRSDLDSIARQVIGLSRQGRSRAIADGEYKLLDIDFEKRRIVMRGEEAVRKVRRGASRHHDDEDAEFVYQFPSGSYVHEFNVPEEFEGLIYDNKSKGRVYFYPDGTSSPVILVLAQERPAREGEGTRTRYYTVEFYRATGLSQSYAGKPRFAEDERRRPPEPLAGRRSDNESLVESLDFIRRGR